MRKKVLSITLAASLAVTSFASLAAVAYAEGNTAVQKVPYSCGFESEDDFKDWTLVDKDGDGENWFLYDTEQDYGTLTHSGMQIAASESYSYIAGALNPDNWLISPAIKIESDSELSFWARGLDPDYASEVFAVYISESTDVDSMTKLGGDYTATDQFVQYKFDLSKYAGKNCYIAIRHYNVTDMYRLTIDDFEVSGTPSTTPDVTPATVTYAQVGSDYTSETEFDNTASFWNVTVTAGTESIEKIDVKLDSIASEEGEQTLETPIVTNAQIVLGVVTNLTGAEVNNMGGFTVMVNGEAL